MQNITFTAKLNYDFMPKDSNIDWKKVAKRFEEKTSDLDTYKMFVMHSEKNKDQLVLSNYNSENNTQFFDVLHKKGFQKIQRLSANEIADKLIFFMRTLASRDKKEIIEINKFKSTYEHPAFIDIKVLEKFYRHIGKILDKNMLKILNEDPVFKDEIDLNTNTLYIFSNHHKGFKM